jgi:hypothetical protein
MEPAEGIGRLGFRKWHERRLLEAHVWLVTSLLCLVTVFAVVEALSFHGPLPRLIAYTTVVFAAGLVGVEALRRYLRLLGEAQRLGEHATCAACGSFGRFTMISAHRVRCRGCANEWRLID